MTIAVQDDTITNLQKECTVLMDRKKCRLKYLATILDRMSLMARIGIWEAPLHI
jgi:hypothetical protein